jgi:hypothetical protein
MCKIRLRGSAREGGKPFDPRKWRCLRRCHEMGFKRVWDASFDRA